jgi:hypothetical protein
MALRNFLDTLCIFGKPPTALAPTLVAGQSHGMSWSSPCTFAGRLLLGPGPNGTNNHSILIILQIDADGFLCFSNQILIEGDMPLPRVRSLGRSLCPAMPQDCALSLEVFVVEGSDCHGSSGQQGNSHQRA